MLKVGVKDEDLADWFGVEITTIYQWKKDYEEFSKAVYEGKYASDFNVVDSFYRRATGFEIDSEKIYLHEGKPIRVPIKEYYPPDSGAALNWLKNRHPEHWRDKKEIELINPKEKLAEILGCKVEELPELVDNNNDNG